MLLCLDGLRFQRGAVGCANKTILPAFLDLNIRDEVALSFGDEFGICSLQAIIDADRNEQQQLKATRGPRDLARSASGQRRFNFCTNRCWYTCAAMQNDRGKQDDRQCFEVMNHLTATPVTLTQRDVPNSHQIQSSCSVTLINPVAPGTLSNAV